MNHGQLTTRGKNEPLRHQDKTADDKTPPHLRRRVIAAQARRDAMRGHGGFNERLAIADADLALEDAPPIKETR